MIRVSKDTSIDWDKRRNEKTIERVDIIEVADRQIIHENSRNLTQAR